MMAALLARPDEFHHISTGSREELAAQRDPALPGASWILRIGPGLSRVGDSSLARV